jgi:putative transposase
MAWKEVSAMEAIMSFVLSVKSAVFSFASLCRRHEISRQTGYKWWRRFRAEGMAGIYERSCRPHYCPHQSSRQWAGRAVGLRVRHPHWGPKKLRAKLAQRYGLEGLPAVSTLGRILVGQGLVRSRRRRRQGPLQNRSELTAAVRPNHVWGVDFKGWFRTGNGQRCDPLTVSDQFSRYVLGCQVVSRPTQQQVQRQFERWFKQYGKPEVIRVDNGPPFGSMGAGGLSALSVWWLGLGIRVEHITPGRPQENGGHERMHRTLKAETTKPSAYSLPAQQKRFDAWVQEFNRERPHEALGQVVPQSLYRRSDRVYDQSPPPWVYEAHWAVRRVRSNGQIRWQGCLRFIGEAFCGQQVGLVEVAKGRQQVYLRDWLLGDLHEDQPWGITPTVRVGRKSANRKQAAAQKSDVQGAPVRAGRGESVTRSDRRPRESGARRPVAVARPARTNNTARARYQEKEKLKTWTTKCQHCTESIV